MEPLLENRSFREQILVLSCLNIQEILSKRKWNGHQKIWKQDCTKKIIVSENIIMHQAKVVGNKLKMQNQKL